jgi:hypothetical protein
MSQQALGPRPLARPLHRHANESGFIYELPPHDVHSLVMVTSPTKLMGGNIPKPGVRMIRK